MEIEQYRNVIENAIQSEIDARRFYEQVSDRIKDDYLKKVFAEFAAEEARHEQILTDILNEKKWMPLILTVTGISMCRKPLICLK